MINVQALQNNKDLLFFLLGPFMPSWIRIRTIQYVIGRISYIIFNLIRLLTAHLTGGGDEDLGLGPLGEPEHVDGADGVGLDGLDRVVHVVGRGGGGRQVVDLVHLDEQGVHYRGAGRKE
jgi:hypothetical protein